MLVYDLAQKVGQGVQGELGLVASVQLLKRGAEGLTLHNLLHVRHND